MLEQGDVVVLDNDKEYVVGIVKELDGVNYAFLGAVENPEDVMLCKVDGEDFEEVLDPAVQEKFFVTFGKEQNIVDFVSILENQNNE